MKYKYTPTGRLDSVEEERGTTTFTYNDRGLLESKTEPDGSTISYLYNDVGAIASVTTPAGTTSYEYDELNRLKHVIEDGETTTYDYDEAGNLEKTTYANGVVETLGYDELNRLVDIEARDAKGDVIA